MFAVTEHYSVLGSQEAQTICFILSSPHSLLLSFILPSSPPHPPRLLLLGTGASREDSVPLSVEGQVQRLIEEATALENLTQMYIGWQPWA